MLQMTATKNTLKSYFESMINKTITAVDVFNDELVIILDDGSEVWVWSDSGEMAIQVSEKPELNG